MKNINIPGIISIGSYGQYSSDNYGVNTLYIELPKITYYFSYQTLVAFYYGNEYCVSHNYWGTTTGKHLNWIDPDHSIRLNNEDFHKRLLEVQKELQS